MAQQHDRSRPGIVKYRLRSASYLDFSFLYDLNVLTMQSYVAQTWGWNDAFQQAYFREHFKPALYRIIIVDDVAAGAVSVEHLQDEVHLAELQLLPDYQHRGIGTRIIQSIYIDAALDGLPVTLQVLKVNPARQLYERLGFHITGETETHFLMCRDVGLSIIHIIPCRPNAVCR
jgi:GNAT superfamily N-acetyltransferase